MKGEALRPDAGRCLETHARGAENLFIIQEMRNPTRRYIAHVEGLRALKDNVAKQVVALWGG